jgi:Flp pilus assembly protein TadD
VLKTDPKSVTALDWLAKALISQERYSAAIELLKKAPADQVLRMDLVIAYSKAGNNEQAIRLLAQMTKQHPSSSAPHFGLATIYTQQNRLEDAAAEFKEAYRLNPRDDATRISYAKILILMADFKAALPVAQSYFHDHPTDFDGHYLMGVVERQLGNNSQAEGMLEEAARLNPEHFDARYNLGVVLVELGKLAQARPQFEKAVQLDPSSGEARFRFANVLRSLGLQDQAAGQFKIYQYNIQQNAKKDVAVNKANQAAQFLAKGEVQRAVDLYREAVEEDPSNAHMFYNLALALDRKGDWSGELDVLEKAVAIDPNFALAHNQMGFLNFQSGRNAEAEREYKIAVTLNPHHSEAKNNLGFLYSQQGKDSEAEQMFRQAIEDDPGYVAAYVNLAVSLASQSRFMEAQSALQNASRLDPGNEQARAMRAQIQAQLSQQGKGEK